MFDWNLSHILSLHQLVTYEFYMFWLMMIGWDLHLMEGWTHMLRKGRQFLLHMWTSSCYSCFKPGDKSCIRKGSDSGRRNCLPFRSIWVHPWFLVGFVFKLDLGFLCNVFVVCPFVLFHLASFDLQLLNIYPWSFVTQIFRKG
jgi:hypothetical protein